MSNSNTLDISQWRNHFIATLLLAMLCLATLLCDHKLSNFTLLDQDGKSEAIELPFIAASRDNTERVYIAKGELYTNALSPRSYQITADTRVRSLKVNGEAVDLSNNSLDAFEDRIGGITANLSDVMHSGINLIEIEFEDFGGAIKIDMHSPPPFWIIVCWFLAIMVAAIKCIKWLNFSTPYAALVFFGITIRFFYLTITGYDTRGHDTGEHIEYILHFVENWSLPSVGAANGGAFFHPPFYYFISAVLYSTVGYLSNNVETASLKSIQVMSFVCSTGFVIYAVKTSQLLLGNSLNMRHINAHRIMAFVCAATIIFWPSGVLHSTRISSDPLLYFSFAAGFYYLFKYHLVGNIKSLYAFLLFGALAVAAKANGVLLLGIGGISFVVHSWKERPNIQRRAWLQLTALGFFACIVSAGTFMPGILLKIKGERTHIYVDNITNVSAKLKVGNKAENYLWFDIKTFITKPYSDPWDDAYGRQYFWNYLAKTGLTGDGVWRFDDPIAHNAIGVLSFCFIVLVICFIVGAYYTPVLVFYQLFPAYLSLFIMFSAVTYMRMTFPVNIDFRYILPAIIPFCLIYSQGLLCLRQAGKTRFFATGLLFMAVFCISSAVFILHIPH